MKKIILALLVAALVAGGAFALDMSAGFGGTFTADFNKVNLTSEGKAYIKTINAMMDEYGYDIYMSEDMYDTDIIGSGFFVYFDAAYVMASLGMTFLDVSYPHMPKELKEIMEITLTYFDIGIFGKYPINLGACTLFPILGLNFKIGVEAEVTIDGESSKLSKIEDPSEWLSSTWFKFGIGADFPIGKKVYLHPLFLYGFGTVSKYFKEYFKEMNKGMNKAMGYDFFDSTVLHGLDVSLALGFKF